MAATQTAISSTCVLKVDIGTAGNPKLRSVSLGSVRPTAEPSGILAVGNAVALCVDPPAVRVERSVKYQIEDV